MPKIKITEIDNTSNGSLSVLDNIVYIPGAAKAKEDAPTLYTTVNELSKALAADDKATSGLIDDGSFKLAKRCIQLRLKVLYQGFAYKKDSTTELDISDADWEALSDKALYDIRFLTTGAYACPTSAMVSCAEKRGDCTSLIDLDQATAKSGAAKIREYFDGSSTTDDEGKITTTTGKGASLRSKYASCFVPWFKATLDENEVSIPGCFGYLFAYARSIQSNPSWYPVAGTFRGTITELSIPDYKFSTADIEILQGRSSSKEVDLDEEGDNVGCAINPIAYVRGYGYLIWGNRTLLINNGGTTASSFLNIRNLCSDIKKTMWSAARKYTFEQNSNTLWLNFRYQITPLLDRMVSGNGIESYTFERVNTTKKARLAARLSIVPIEGVEDFELEVYLEDSLEVVE